MLDLLYLSLLLAPFAFFWCCCGVTCVACPDGVSANVQVTFPGLDPVTDCTYCATWASTVFTLPEDFAEGESPDCRWRLLLPYEERFCNETYVDPGDGLTYGRISVLLRVTVASNVVRLELGAIEEQTGNPVGSFEWSEPMPSHSGGTGPCGAQTILMTPANFVDLGDVPDYLSAACDFSAITPEVTFFAP